MRAYYNEFDAYAAQWLRNLIANGLVAPGDVDERSITDVNPDDLRGYDQCHFFAGIGGWSYALRLAGWPDDEPVWTGSCPCQPLSGAGKRKGHADGRHLWPAFHDLIAECRPAIVFGEQVASKDGREWLAAVRADLEDVGFAVGAADLPAACTAAKHNRPRLFWVADAQKREGVGSAHNARRRASSRDEVPEPRDGDCSPDGCGSGKHMDKPPLPVLAYAVPGLVGAVAAYGNAIVPQVAEQFIRAYLDTRNEIRTSIPAPSPAPPRTLSEINGLEAGWYSLGDCKAKR